MKNRGVIMSEEERISVLNWVKDTVGVGLRDKRIHIDLDESDATIPQAIWDIKQRIVERENLHGYEKEPVYKDFLAIVLPGGMFIPHTDPNKGECIHTRFNVFFQLPEKGGRVYYSGKLIESKEGCYVMCRSGLDIHWGDKNKDTKGRVSISFGFLIPRTNVDKIYYNIPK
jgi:hypothetical protein